MSFHSIKPIAGSAACFLLINCCVLLATVICARIPPLPDSLRVSSKLVYLEGTRQKFFKIDEFIGLRSDGSIRLNVADYSNVYSLDSATKSTYFRLLQGVTDAEKVNGYDKNMVALNLRTSECRHEHTSSWILSDYSLLLSKIAQKVQTSDANHKNSQDPIGIGPTALLQLVYESPSLFRLDSKAYEDLVMADCYHFSAILNNFPTESAPPQSAKLIVSILADRVEFPTKQSSKPELIGTPLSEVNLSQHPTMVALVVVPNVADASKLKSSELLASLKSGNAQKSGPPRPGLMISYDLIQERSISRHSGLEYLSDELANPFELPVSCGSFTLQRPLYVNPRQFSGQFEALGFEQKFAVAYDWPTNHFRYDSLNEFKLIYSLNDHLATFISTSNQPILAPSKKSKKTPQTYYHQAHQNKERCAQTSIFHENLPPSAFRSWLYDKNSLADILGLGDRVGLMYLGQKRVPVDEDDDHDELMICQVFEREIRAAQIPALLGIHARADLGKRDSRLFLVFYLIEEIGTNFERQFGPPSWQSMWLKRVELVSFEPVGKYQRLEARLTFSSFSWSLESVETSDALTSRQAELTHPAHTFDTLECWSERGQLQVDFLLKQVDEQEWDKAMDVGNRLKKSLQIMSSLEETVLVFLERTLMMPRAQINELNIVAPSMKSVSEVESTESNSLVALGNLWISFKLTKPFNYLHKRTLVGWTENYLELFKAKQAKLVKYKTKMAYHECASRIATQLGQPQSVYMLHCPELGCAYLTVDKLEGIKYKKFEEIKNHDNSPVNKSPFDNSLRTCEIHQLVKTMSMREIESDIYKPEVIRRYLSKSSLLIYASDENYATMQEQEREPYRAHVTKVSLREGESNHDSWDEEVMYGLCYTPATILKFNGKTFEDKRHGFHVLQLQLDYHHSRAHCRRACLLKQFCQTYSYNRATRQCTLTNIARRILSEPNFSLDSTKLDSSESCSIYALDNLVLYKRSNKIEEKMPVELVEDRRVLVLSLSLSQCASLCHMDESAFNESNTTTGSKTINCQSFSYLSLHSLCVIKTTDQDLDYETGLVKREEHLSGPVELEARMGSKQKMYEANAYESYTRSYSSYLASRYGIKIYLNGPSEQNEEAKNGPLEEVLQGSSLAECQRECLILRQDCAMLDHCLVNKNSIQQEICHLYSIRSPLSFASFKLDEHPHPSGESFKKLQLQPNNKLAQQLTDSEKLFYLDGQSNKHDLVIHSRNCNHFYLDGNNLFLKRLLAKSAANSLDGKSIENLVERDETTNQSGKSSMDTTENFATPIAEQSFVGDLQTVTKVCIGLAIGLLVFLIQPAIVGFATKTDLVKSFHSIRWFHSFTASNTRSRSERTMSMVDIVELSDIDSP